MRSYSQNLSLGGCARGVTAASVAHEATVDPDPALRQVTVLLASSSGSFLSAREADDFPAMAQ